MFSAQIYIDAKSVKSHGVTTLISNGLVWLEVRVQIDRLGDIDPGTTCVIDRDHADHASCALKHHLHFSKVHFSRIQIFMSPASGGLRNSILISNNITSILAIHSRTRSSILSHALRTVALHSPSWSSSPFPLQSSHYSSMPPKRKAKPQAIPANAASAASYTDPTGSAPNKRSRISKPTAKIDSYLKDDPGNTAVVTNGRNLDVDEEPAFDHSRPEERAGIVDKRFYPTEISNERCAMYNDNLIPRPLEVLEDTIRRASHTQIEKNNRAERAVIHWFKRDLRLHDNTGLRLAAEAAKEKGIGVVGLWILSPQDWEAHLVSPAKCDFELRSLAVLQRDLAALNIPLHFEVVDDRKRVPQRIIDLSQEWGVREVYCNMEYEVDELRRDTKLLEMCLAEGIRFNPTHDDCVVPPGSLKTGGGKQFAVYSPYFRAWIKYLHEHPEILAERQAPTPNPADFRDGQFKRLFGEAIPKAPESKRLDDETKARLAQLYPAGESAALDRLQHFLTEKIGDYKATRNFPAKNSTACVSVHHSAGTLAARTSIRMARDVNSTKKLDGGNEGIRNWISEVAWRDFYRHVLVNWPYVW